MLHYLMYRTLADGRMRDLVAVARRRQLVAEAIHDSRDAKRSVMRLREITAQMVALLNGRRGARATVTLTSTSRGGSMLSPASDACPIGCAT